jgi:hypothetical protein
MSWLERFALTMLGKVGTSVSNLDELYKRWRFKKGKAEQIRTPVPLSTTTGAEGSILIDCVVCCQSLAAAALV